MTNFQCPVRTEGRSWNPRILSRPVMGCFISLLHSPSPGTTFVPLTEISLVMAVNVTAKHALEIQ